MKKKKWLSLMLGILAMLLMSIPVSAATLKTPVITKVSSVDYKSTKITWNKISGASGYEVYRHVSNKKPTKIVNIKNGSKTYYIDKKAVTGTKYFYSVKAYQTKNGKKIYSSASKEKSGKAVLGTTKLTPFVFKGQVDPTVTGFWYRTTWKKVPGATGYEIKLSRHEYGDAPSKYYTTVYTTKNTEYMAGIGNNDKFGACVRAYTIKNNKKIYGPYSKWTWKVF